MSTRNTIDYVTLIELLAKPNKYTQWYATLCYRARARAATKAQAYELLGEVVEGHHIVPKCFKMGGRYDKHNLVYLTLREHFVVHLLLTRMFEGELHIKMLGALTLMSASGRFKRGVSRKYQKLRREFYARRHALIPGWTPRNGTRRRKRSQSTGTGTPHTKEWRTAQAERVKQQWAQPGARQALRDKAREQWDAAGDVERSRTAALELMSDPAARARISAHQKGRFPVFNAETNVEKRILPVEFERYAAEGFVRGRRPKIVTIQ